MPSTVAGPEERGRLVNGAAAGVAALVALLLTLALHGDLWRQLGTAHPASAFHASHVWPFEHIVQMVLGNRPWSLHSPLLGWPEGAEVRLIAWGPTLLIYLPLRALLDPLPAFNLTFLLGPATSAGLGTLALGALTRSSPWTAAAGGLAVALAPFFLGTLASGQVAKVQAWVLLVHLWALWCGRGGRGALALVLVTVVGTLTSPSFGLLLPLTVGVVLLLALTRRVEGAPPPLQALLGGVLTALGMVPAWLYYRGVRGGENVQGFAPAGVSAMGTEARAGEPQPSAQLWETLTGQAWENPAASMPVHLTYLSVLLVVALVVALGRRSRGSSLALGLVLVGVGVAAGPELAVGDTRLSLPAAWLAAAGYPLADSGMWYRAVALAAVGLGLGLVGACRGLRGGPVLAWGMALGVVADGVRSSSSLWPRATVDISAELDLARTLRDDPSPGAVLDLPLQPQALQAGESLLRAAVHRRATVAVARAGRVEDSPALAQLEERLGPALSGRDPERSHALLLELGVHTVTAPRSGLSGRPISVLYPALGEPDEVGRLVVWRVRD